MNLAMETFKVLLWLAALDPDPYPRCVEVRSTDITRFPPEGACLAEMDFWRKRADWAKKHLDASVSPWNYELRREYELADWTGLAWSHLAEARWASNHHWADCQVVCHLGKYREHVGDAAYVTGWSPARTQP